VLLQPGSELADRGRLARPVDADHEYDARPRLKLELAGVAEHPRDFLLQRRAQICRIAARLQPLHQLGSRRHADVGGDQRLFETLPGRLLGRVEARERELLGQRSPALAE
jgi:hypothetical protein